MQTVSLSAGDAGNRVEFANSIDWRTLSANLKAAIPLVASNTDATYNWDIGTIERSNAQMRQFEVASHRWIDLTDKSGSFGTTILTDCKNGSDKPSDNTVRMTLLRSPGVLPENGRPSPYTDQANQDWGHHEVMSRWSDMRVTGDGRRPTGRPIGFNDPLIAFETTHHSGSLGKNFSLMNLSNSRVRVLALKRAEDSDEIVLRMVELDGKNASNVKVSFAGQLTAAREINAQEQPVGSAVVSGGTLTTSFTPYQPRTYALRLGAPAVKLAATHSQSVQLNYDLLAASHDDSKIEGDGMDGKGNTLPAEMLPAKIEYNGVEFQLAPAASGKPNAVIAKGQQNHPAVGLFQSCLYRSCLCSGRPECFIPYRRSQRIPKY